MPAKVFAVVAYLLGAGGAGLFYAYVIGTGTGYWPRSEPADGQTSIRIDVALLALFALQHSGMARTSFKRHFGALGRSLYVAASGLTVGTLTILWQPIPGEPSWHGPIAIVAISLLAGLGIGACSVWFDHATFLGLTQAWTGQADIHGPLRIEGPYRYVRHPLMLGILIAIWAQPIMPQELLLLNGGMTAYILAAIQLEERDLVREFGEEYENYCRDVPPLIPGFRERRR